MSTARLRGLAPAADRRVETLILGSFPSETSLAAGEYYAHPRNQFWRILSAVLDEPLAAMLYAQRLARLHAHSIGLWDVLGACERAGSLDSAIRDEQENDVTEMLHRMPRLRRVLFNGQRAARARARFQAIGLETVVVPSSSPAHAALALAAKVALWRQALADGRRKALPPAPARSTG